MKTNEKKKRGRRGIRPDFMDLYFADKNAKLPTMIAAIILGFSINYLYRLSREGKIKRYKLSDYRYYYLQSDLSAYHFDTRLKKQLKYFARNENKRTLLNFVFKLY